MRRRRMDKKAMITQRDISFDNLRKKERIKTILELADDLRSDPSKKERKEQNLCLICFYQSRGMHTNAFVTTDCKVCGKEMFFVNSDIDKIGLECAKKYQLCKHCGCDIEYKERRNNKRNDFKYD